MPFTPGVELCGEVVEIGDDVTRAVVGDRVVGTPILPGGAFAEYAHLLSRWAVSMLYCLRMLLMGPHFLIAGVLGYCCVCRPFNPDNSRLCARLYALPAMWILRLQVKAQVDLLRDKPNSCVIIANHQSNYDLFVFGNVVPYRTVCIGKKSPEVGATFRPAVLAGGQCAD